MFLVIALLLGTTSLHALHTLDQFARLSREAGQHALVLTANASRLDERGIAMQRAARQFVVLDDPAFRDRYTDALRDAGRALGEIEAGIPAPQREMGAQWRRAAAAALAVLRQPSDPATAATRTGALAAALAPMPNLQAQLATEVRHEIERRNLQLLDDLEAGRNRLTVQVLVALLVALLLALAFAMWMSRPLARIGAAINQLGANRFDTPIDVPGPHDLRHVGRQLDWLRLRLAALEEDKARFLRHVSHELKTPLAAICEGVALLADGLVGRLTPHQDEIVSILRQNTGALHTQIEDLLRYNEASFGTRSVQREPVDLAALVRGVVDKLRLQLEAARVRVELTGSAPPLAADADKLSAAVTNLLLNAVRFSQAGATVWLGLSQRHAQVTLDCIDAGPGVAAADAGKIFDPFYQGERQPPGARKGNGIGLSIVREYARAHGGSVELLPSVKGAHFRLTLPYET